MLIVARDMTIGTGVVDTNGLSTSVENVGAREKGAGDSCSDTHALSGTYCGVPVASRKAERLGAEIGDTNGRSTIGGGAWHNERGVSPQCVRRWSVWAALKAVRGVWHRGAASRSVQWCTRKQKDGQGHPRALRREKRIVV